MTTKKSQQTLEANIYSQEGKEVGSVKLPEQVFGAAWNPELVHEVVVSMQGNARSNSAHTKNRGEVRGGGKKPWRQKGTGRARHGSTRSPIWVGGGQAHGPRNERDFGRKINKNARAKALASVLSKKLADDHVIFVDALTFGAPKTKDARTFISALGGIKGKETIATKKANAALVLLSDRNAETELSFRNFGNVEVKQAKDVNPVELLNYKYVVVAKPDAALKILEGRVSTKAARKVTAVTK
ncbi:MAG TPA: 50S ribosomal protein L4 [Candidatus Paceibacterota bacterium]|nr:50S ribosomal protein L4 [Candidatus Paceibacterota bacterium]